MIGLWVLLAAVLVAVLIGLAVRRRSGSVRPVTAGAPAELASLLAEAGFTHPSGTPLLLHFSAPWCGPCAGVRRVVDQIAGELPWLGHLEVDVTEHPQLSAALRVLSLPTVLVYDASLQQRFRVAGAPSVGDLRAVLAPMAPGDAVPGSADG